MESNIFQLSEAPSSKVGQQCWKSNCRETKYMENTFHCCTEQLKQVEVASIMRFQQNGCSTAYLEEQIFYGRTGQTN